MNIAKELIEAVVGELLSEETLEEPDESTETQSSDSNVDKDLKDVGVDGDNQDDSDQSDERKQALEKLNAVLGAIEKKGAEAVVADLAKKKEAAADLKRVIAAFGGTDAVLTMLRNEDPEKEKLFGSFLQATKAPVEKVDAKQVYDSFNEQEKAAHGQRPA